MKDQLPKPDADHAAAGRRFTVLRHRVGKRFRRENLAEVNTGHVAKAVAAGPVHWDWLFAPIDSSHSCGDPVSSSDRGGMLWTWATDPLPGAVFGDVPAGDVPRWKDAGAAGLQVPAIRLPDHRPVYLDYQGELSDQRGEVEQLVTGTYRVDGPIGELETRFDVRLCFRSSGKVERRIRVRFRRDQCAEAFDPSSSFWTLRLESVTGDSGSSAADAIE